MTYESLKELTAINMGEEWFYVNSHLLDPTKYEFKYANQVSDADRDRLLDLVVDEICRKAKERPQLTIDAIAEINAALAETSEEDAAYYNLVTWQMGMPNLPFTTWQEYKAFLEKFKEKLRISVDA